MSWPPAIKLFTVTFGPGTTLALGTELGMKVDFTPSTSAVWAATGTPLIALVESATADEGQEGSATLPNPDQDGFIDGNGNTVKNWTYRAAVSYTLGGRVVATASKVFTVTAADTTVDLDTLIPVTGSSGVVVAIPDSWSATVLEAQAAADEVNVGRLSPEQLNGTIVAVGGESFASKPAGLDSVIAKLDMKADSTVVIVSCGDSTMDSASEYFALPWRELAALWPERYWEYYAWSKPADAYIAPVVWQDGGTDEVIGGTEVQTIGFDTFMNVVSELIGTTPTTGSGSAWTGTSGAYESDGQKIDSIYTGAGIPAAYFTPKTRNGTDGEWHYRGIELSTTNASSKQTRLYGPYLTSTNGVKLSFVGSSALTITLQKVIGGTTTTIATFDAGTIPPSSASTEFDASIVLVGTTITATVNGATVTGTLTSGDLTALAGAGRVGFESGDPSFKIDEVEAIGTVTVASESPQPTALPYVSVYNPAVAGSTAAWHQDQIAVAYPVRPDVLFFGHGHNYAVTVDVAEFLAAVQAFIDAVYAVYPGVPVVIMSENPRIDPADRIEEQQQRQQGIRAYAMAKGWDYIGTYEALAAQPNLTALMNDDGVHPLPAGSRVQADTVKAFVKAKTVRT